MKYFAGLFLLLNVAIVLAEPKPGDFFAQGPATGQNFSLTFDDGPGRNTEKFLDLLDRYQVKGTFFMLGQQVQTRPKVARMVGARGHEVASHTYSHVNYLKHLKAVERELGTGGEVQNKAISKAEKNLVADMRKTRLIIEKATEQKIKICRMPHGIDRPWIKKAAKEDGVVLVNWTFGADWTKTPLEKLKQDYVRAIKPGAILLFHDDGKNWEQTLQIVESVIQAAQEKGYSIVPVSTLLSIQ